MLCFCRLVLLHHRGQFHILLFSSSAVPSLLLNKLTGVRAENSSQFDIIFEYPNKSKGARQNFRRTPDPSDGALGQNRTAAFSSGG